MNKTELIVTIANKLDKSKKEAEQEAARDALKILAK